MSVRHSRTTRRLVPLAVAAVLAGAGGVLATAAPAQAISPCMGPVPPPDCPPPGGGYPRPPLPLPGDEPEITGFTASPGTIQACAPRQVTLAWSTDDATHVVVKVGGTVLADRTQSTSDPWSGSVTAPATDGGQTYTITAYNADGDSTSRSVTVSRTSSHPLVHSLTFSNVGQDTLEAVRVAADGTLTPIAGPIPPGYYQVVTLTNCQLDRIVVIDVVTGLTLFDSGSVLGYNLGENDSFGIHNP